MLVIFAAFRFEEELKRARQADALDFAKTLYNSVQGSAGRVTKRAEAVCRGRFQPLDGTPGWYTPGQCASGRGALRAVGDRAITMAVVMPPTSTTRGLVSPSQHRGDRRAYRNETRTL